MTVTRLDRWVRASHGISGGALFSTDNFYSLHALQGLGRLDCQLIPEEERFLRLLREQGETVEVAVQRAPHITVSHLWILGVYELVRTLDQRCRAGNLVLLSDDLKNRVREFKHGIESLRIPLAKPEADHGHHDLGPIGLPSFHPQHGVIWQVTAADTHITRRQLSDTLLSLVESIAREWES